MSRQRQAKAAVDEPDQRLGQQIDARELVDVERRTVLEQNLDASPFCPESVSGEQRQILFGSLQPAVALDRHVEGPTTVGDNVWCGANVVITSGVTVGERCVIGANSVVTSDIPPYSIAAGSPARVLREITY